MMRRIMIVLYFVTLSLYVKSNAVAQKDDLVVRKVAGIEVGAKGVKMTVLEINAGVVKVLKDSSVNTDFISFTSESYDATLNAFSGLYNYIKQVWNVNGNEIATVISSGVQAQASKLNKQLHLKTFIDAFRIKINDDKKIVEVVDVLKESILSHYGIISDENRFNTFLIDIGSGNTKGGYFQKDTKNFVMFQIPSGTKSTYNLIEKKCGTANQFSNFQKLAFVVVDSLEKSEITYAVNASGAYPRSNTMALSGGIAWAIATLLQPEKSSVNSMEVTYKDIVKFRDNLIKFEKDIPDTNKIIIKGLKPNELNKIRTEVSRVLKVFDTKTLMAGSSLLLKIMRQFESNGTKKFTLIKNGQVGWITGYILNKGGIGVQ